MSVWKNGVKLKYNLLIGKIEAKFESKLPRVFQLYKRISNGIFSSCLI